MEGNGWRLAIRVLAPLCALILEGWPALIAAVVVQEGGLWLARRLSDACHRRFVSDLFLVAYAARLAILAPTHYLSRLSNGNGSLYRDDYTNDLVAEWLVRIARGEGATAIFPGHQYLLNSVYTYLVMALYAVFGYAPVVPKLLNIGLAALCAVLVFELARKAFSQRVAVIAALGMAFLPSLVVWSIATLKETLVLCTCLVGLWVLQLLTEAEGRDRRVPTAIVVLFGATLLLVDLRLTSAVIFVGLLAIILISRLHVRVRAWRLAVAGVAVAAVLIGGVLVVRERTSNRPLSAMFEDLALDIRHRRAQEAAGAGSQLRTDPETDTDVTPDRPAAEVNSDASPFSFATDILDPLGYALFAPTPWDSQSRIELAASAEMVVWDVLLLASFLAWRAGPRQRLFFVCLVLYGIANWLILAAVEGNVGNLLRHRLMLDPVLLILGAAGLDWVYQRMQPDQRCR